MQVAMSVLVLLFLRSYNPMMRFPLPHLQSIASSYLNHQISPLLMPGLKPKLLKPSSFNLNVGLLNSKLDQQNAEERPISAVESPSIVEEPQQPTVKVTPYENEPERPKRKRKLDPVE